MGLDMYLTGKRYLWTIDEHEDVSIAKKVANLLGIDKQVKEICIELGYWRKANQIHKWFVDNVQNGEDNCGEYYVSEDHLNNLLDIVEEVLADHDLAKDLLPSQAGFFFGHYDYDEWYFQDLEKTKEIIVDTLKFIKEQHKEKSYVSVYYSSSW